MKPKRAHLAGCLVLLCAGLAAWLAMRSGDADGPADSVIPPRANGRHVAGEDPAAPRAGGPRQRDMRMEPPRYEHTANQLGDFMVVNVEGRDVTLRAAVNLLMSAYKDASRQSRTAPLDFDFAFPESDARISFSIERTDFMAALRHIAALAGYEVRVTGVHIAFHPMDSGPGAGTDTIVLNRMDALRIREVAARIGIAATGDMAADLRALGIAVEAVEGAPAGGDFTIRNASPLVQKQIESLLATMQGPRQLVARTKLIQTHGELPLESPYLDADETAAWLRMAAQRSDTTVMALPSVTLRNGEESTVEIIKQKGDDDWTGIKVDLVAEPMGLGMVSRDTVRIRPEESPGVRMQNTGRAALMDGESHVSVVGENDGITTYRMLSVEKITATGHPWRSPGSAADGTHAVAEALAGQEGMVISPFSGNVVDVRGIPAGTLVADPTFPMEERKFFRVP